MLTVVLKDAEGWHKSGVNGFARVQNGLARREFSANGCT
jgi:hypothetical protein